MTEQQTLIEPQQPLPEQPGWGHCRTCSAGYAEVPDAKGQCTECRRTKAFTKPILDSLTRIEKLLDAIKDGRS